MTPKLIDFCSSGNDKVFSFEEHKNYRKAIKEYELANGIEFKVIDIQLEDMKQISIGSNKTNKVICWLNTEDLEWDYLIQLANQICDNLNSIK